MRKYLKVQLAKQVFDGIVNFQVYNPQAVDNACILLDVNINDPLKRNALLNWFMTDRMKYEGIVPCEPTEEELKQMDYIRKHMNENITGYIKAMDFDDQLFNPNVPNALDVLFTVADKVNDTPPKKIELNNKPDNNKTEFEIKIEGFDENKPKRGRKAKGQ